MRSSSTSDTSSRQSGIQPQELKYYYFRQNFQKFEPKTLTEPKSLSKIKTSPLHPRHVTLASAQEQQQSLEQNNSQRMYNTNTQEFEFEKSKSFHSKPSSRDASFQRTRSYTQSKRDAIANNKNVMKIINESLQSNSNVCDVLWVPAIKLTNKSIQNADLRYTCVGSMDILYPTYKGTTTSSSDTSESNMHVLNTKPPAYKPPRPKKPTLSLKKSIEKMKQIDESESFTVDKENTVVPPKRTKLKLKNKQKTEPEIVNDTAKPEAPKRKKKQQKEKSETNVHLKDILSHAGDLTQLLLPIIRLAGLSGGVHGDKYQKLVSTYKDVKEKSKIKDRGSKNTDGLINMTAIDGLQKQPTPQQKPKVPTPPQPPPRLHSLSHTTPSIPVTPGKNTNHFLIDNHSHNESTTRTAKSSVSSGQSHKLETFKNEIDKTMNELTKFQNEVSNRIQTTSSSTLVQYPETKRQYRLNIHSENSNIDTGVNTDISMCNAVFTIKYDSSNIDTSTSSVQSTNKQQQQRTPQAIIQNPILKRLSTPSTPSTESGQSTPRIPKRTFPIKSQSATQTNGFNTLKKSFQCIDSDESAIVNATDIYSRQADNKSNLDLSKKLKLNDTNTIKLEKIPINVTDAVDTPRTISSSKDDTTFIMSVIPLKRNTPQRYSLPISSDYYKSNTSLESAAYTNTVNACVSPRNIVKLRKPNVVKIKDARFSRSNNSYQTYPKKSKENISPYSVLNSGASSTNAKNSLTTINYITFDELDKKIYRYHGDKAERDSSVQKQTKRPNSHIETSYSLRNHHKNERVIDDDIDDCDENSLPITYQSSKSSANKNYNLRFQLNGTKTLPILSQTSSSSATVSPYTTYSSLTKRPFNRIDNYKIRYPLDEIEEQIEELLINKSIERLNNLKVKYMTKGDDKPTSAQATTASSIKPVRFIYRVCDSDEEIEEYDNHKPNIPSKISNGNSLFVKPTKLNSNKKNEFNETLIKIN